MRTPLFLYRLRKRLRRLNPVLLAITLGIILAAAGSLALFEEAPLGPPESAEAQPAAVAVESPSPASSPPSAKLSERMEAAVVEKMRQRPDADLSSLPLLELPPPLLSIDGSSFRRGEDTIRLDRIVGPRADEVCLDDTLRWSCGLQARAAFHNLVAGRNLLCQPRRALADGGIGADCRLGARDALPAGDVARQLVQQGWARPVPASEAEFAAEVAQAKAAEAGLWRGGWRLSTP